MIMNDSEVSERLNSPLNLINRINNLSRPKLTGMEIFKPSRNDSDVNDVDELDELIPDNAAKIKLGLVKAKALDVMHDSLVLLGKNLDNVNKTKDLSTIAKDMKIILSEEETTAKNSMNIVVYKPVTNEITKYDTIVVNE